MKSSTAAAISTANAPGGIGIIRISGDDAVSIAAKVFRPLSGEDLTLSKGYRAHYGYVYDGGERIDEAVCLIYRAPHSYTGEDVAEINCHGGMYLTRQVLRCVLAAGAEPAGPGEFTKRAFLNGKKDLAGSESVMALIGASGRKAASAALNTLEGKLSGRIRECCDAIKGVCASLTAWVDYPDEDIDEIGRDEMLAVFESTASELDRIITAYDNGKAVTQGVDTVIAGRPNVGKSTVMNMLTGYDRSIVTDIAGTTRDVVEERITLGDIVLNLADTAGIRETLNTVESIGVEVAKKRLDRAELLLAVFDGSSPLSTEDEMIIKLCEGKKSIALINKSDLGCVIGKSELESSFDRVINISALKGEGINELEDAIAGVFAANEFDPSLACLTCERQRNCCVKAKQNLDEAIASLRAGVTLDAVNVCADCAVDALLELTGEKATAAVIDEVFSRFCVGK